MKIPVIYLFLSILVYSSCSLEKNETIPDNKVELTPIRGYFSKRKPYKTEGYVLNKRSFNLYFSPARTMGDSLPEIDFTTKKVGAIIMPETSYDTRIILNNAYLSDSILHIQYSIHEVLEKRPYTIIPVRLFTFDADIEADQVHFEYGEHVIKKPIK